MGLEKNEHYLKKKERAAETIYYLYNNNKFKDPHINGLLHAYLTLKKYNIKTLFTHLYKILKPFLKHNILSRKPSLLILNLYRLGYFCTLDAKK